MNASTRDVWFFSRDGQQSGPLTYADLKEKADEGVLKPRHDLVWKEGMADWRPIGEIEGLFERQPLQVPNAPVAESYVAPTTVPTDLPEGEFLVWPGARRRTYLVATVIFPALWFFVLSLAPMLLGTAVDPALLKKIILVADFLPVLVALYYTLQRLVNLGMNRFWIAGMLVPLLNIWVGYRIFACPAGFAFHKRMDGAGIFLAILYWLWVVICIVALVAVIAILAGSIGDASNRDAIKKILDPIIEQLRGTTQSAAK